MPALKHALDALGAKVDELGGTVTASFVDVETGDVLASKHAKRALNPASNAKVLTAATALAKLHGSHRYVTALYGKVKGGAAANVVLRGSGDPSLTTADLWELVRDLKAAGVKRVEGNLLVDQRFFDEQFTPPAFEQQPNEWASFRAPISALAVNGNTITLTVRPGAAGSAAQATFDPPGFVDVDGQVKTVDGAAAQNVILTLSGKGSRLTAQLAGSIPESSRALSFTRRVEDPRLLGGYVVKALLAEAQIAFAGEVKLGGERSRAPAIAVHRSKPLSTLLYELGKQSDNFYAEMVWKTLALEEKGRPAKAGGAAEVVTQYLAEIGAAEEGTVVKNGSGLFDANRVSASVMTKVLRAAMRDGAISSEFVAQLAVGGQDGTLRHRFRDTPSRGIVRAKTGTLEGAASLSGYVMAPAGRSPVAFSIIINGVPGKVSTARAVMDKAVGALITHLWAERAAK
ncbi:MAG: D-alanyl-D-alanine carboxypeptidase/D-alanyl-D-alanine-endopeptidase [Polyangiaceae bacterium]|nr:D-alanyl-D-alanine carboxypeptidase/D-alanyl-D-alanine-endopeptidase [Polyangiaceae bacterium]